MENFNKIKELVSLAEQDAVKFFQKSNKSAGTRLRKYAKQIADLSKVLRKQVSEIKSTQKEAKKAE